MQSGSNEKYKELSDKAIVEKVLHGDDQGMWYLLFDRYEEDMRYYCWRHYESFEYLKELCDELFIRLKGKENDWARLKAFRWKSSFRTWLSSIADNLFLGLRKDLVSFHHRMVPIDENQYKSGDEKSNIHYVMMLEAINRLENEEYKLILIKELEGYKPEEIAEMLDERRERLGKTKIYNGEESHPTSAYVYMAKNRAIKELKVIVNQIKEEQYGGK